MADPSVFDAGVLGTNYLPPSPAYPVDQLTASLAPPASAASTAGAAVGAAPAGLNVPVGPPAAAASVAPPPAPAVGQPGGDYLRQILGMLQPQQTGGFSVPSFMASLGTGLSSAGQNWNKPAAAAFASGAGAAIQGGQQWQNQLQDAKLKAIHAALAAWKIGDIAAYHRSLADYHKAVAKEKRQGARPATPPPEPPQSQLPAPSGVEPAQTAPPAAPPAGVDAASADAAQVQPQVMVAHRAALDRLLTDAEVPSHRVEAADLESAARLMATKALPADEAFERASLHNVIDAGHVSPAEVDLIYGPGVADAIRSTAAS